ncbi:unnamed protein product [Paramecium pentaurelia]|uniref:Uncharacterized protein n=1 Tax=Paramecium pentaurelia TaxID=43138 RepID=A0A8S1TXP3_9CILI|nr:unnamed protein product [Paramecium pentaurelia]
MYKQVQFKLIDDQYQQIGLCQAISFKKDESIMISSDSNIIKIWNFQQGRFKLSNSYIQKQIILFQVLDIFKLSVDNKLNKMNGSVHNHSNKILVVLIIQYQINNKINLFPEGVMKKQQFSKQVLERMS